MAVTSRMVAEEVRSFRTVGSGIDVVLVGEQTQLVVVTVRDRAVWSGDWDAFAELIDRTKDAALFSQLRERVRRANPELLSGELDVAVLEEFDRAIREQVP